MERALILGYLLADRFQKKRILCYNDAKDIVLGDSMQNPRENTPNRSIFSRLIAFSSNLFNRLRGRDTTETDSTPDPILRALETDFDATTHTTMILQALDRDKYKHPISIDITAGTNQLTAAADLCEIQIKELYDQQDRLERLRNTTLPVSLQSILHNLPAHFREVGLRDAQEWYYNRNPTANTEETNAEKLGLFDGLELDIPDDFICPITLQIMTDPVIAPGYPQRYERSAITAWVEGNRTNPVNRQPLHSRDLVADKNLKAQIDLFVQSTISQLRTMIQP